VLEITHIVQIPDRGQKIFSFQTGNGNSFILLETGIYNSAISKFSTELVVIISIHPTSMHE